MYLYEKEKDKVNVYELKEMKEKLFEYKRHEMEKQGMDELVYSALSNNGIDICRFRDLSLYEFTNVPIKKLDWETVQFMKKDFLTDDDFELNQNILKMVRQINK